MSYLTPFIDIIPNEDSNTKDYPINIKTTIAKLKDEINVEELLPHMYKNKDFVDFVKSTNYKFIPHMDYYNQEVANYFDIYGGSYNIVVDKIEYNIKIYFYKIKNPELLTKEIINKFKLIFRYDYFVKNNILNMSWHEYSLKKYFIDNLNKQKFLDISYNTPVYCKTQLFNHQKNNLARMFNIHSNTTTIYITENMPMFFENDLIFDMTLDKFISHNEISSFEINSGMILDEPGTGKTLQFILYLLEIKLKSLVIVPNDNIKSVWIEEFAKHIDMQIPFDIFTFGELNQMTPEFLNQYQVIGIDEIHNLYKNNLNLFHKIIQSKIKYRWGITGTPFVSNTSFFQIIKFLTGHIFNNERMAHSPCYQKTLAKFFLKNNKTDMIEYEWPEIIMDDVYVKLDVVQQRMYDTEKMIHTNTNQLRKLVCSINLIGDADDIVSPNEMKQFYIQRIQQLYEQQKTILEELKDKLKNVEDNADSFEVNEYNKRIEHFKVQVDKQTEKTNSYERAYNFCLAGFEVINKVVNKKRKAEEEPDMTELSLEHEMAEAAPAATAAAESSPEPDMEEETCAICFGDYSLPISYIKSCGHYYCKSCLDLYMNTYKKNSCPKCRKIITTENIINVNDIGDINNSSKIHELLQIIKTDNVIIFTQFDSVLGKIQKYLQRNNVSSSTLNKYTNQQVLLLSSSHNAEGINLNHFDNMIIFEPFEDSVYCNEVEKQLIARIHRIGRTKPVNVYRFITEGTIEEDIYNGVK
jgi:SNF2 family DNA or RNA helicase